jgi:tagatose 1,6-diphosphate aldolase GatY/KbaY
MISGLKRILLDYKIQKKAIAAFNIQNIYQYQALSSVCDSLKMPVMAQFSKSYIDYFNNLYDFKKVIENSSELMFFHLDHCDDLNLIDKCIGLGFDSVMYDGSHLDLISNINNSNAAYNLARKSGVVLEVELGSIGGVEDGIGDDKNIFFDMNDFLIFKENCKYDLIALAIGNAHGIYNVKPNINLNSLREAHEANRDMLHVLHGGTGLDFEIIKSAISYGTVKVNYSTELKIETLKTLNNFVECNNIYDEKLLHRFYLDGLSPFFTTKIKSLRNQQCI